MALGLSTAKIDILLQRRMETQRVNECCTLIYTSGTTGDPKVREWKAFERVGGWDAENIVKFYHCKHAFTQYLSLTHSHVYIYIHTCTCTLLPLFHRVLCLVMTMSHGQRELCANSMARDGPASTWSATCPSAMWLPRWAKELCIIGCARTCSHVCLDVHFNFLHAPCVIFRRLLLLVYSLTALPNYFTPSPFSRES